MICPICEEYIDDESRKCEYCGAEVIPQNISVNNPTDAVSHSCLKLYALIQRREIVIRDDGIIGRKGNIDKDFFSKFPTISEFHCRIFLCNNRWNIEHLSNTNPTVLNGNELAHNNMYPIRNNDKLVISDMLFKVSVFNESITKCENNDKTNEKTNAEILENWYITCPVCGTNYQVDHPMDQICLCDVCDDQFDKRVKAKKKARIKTGITGRRPLTINVIKHRGQEDCQCK